MTIENWPMDEIEWAIRWWNSLLADIGKVRPELRLLMKKRLESYIAHAEEVRYGRRRLLQNTEEGERNQ